jgi:hypothetical protein
VLVPISARLLPFAHMCALHRIRVYASAPFAVFVLSDGTAQYIGRLHCHLAVGAESHRSNPDTALAGRGKEAKPPCFLLWGDFNGKLGQFCVGGYKIII